MYELIKQSEDVKNVLTQLEYNYENGLHLQWNINLERLLFIRY